MTQKFANNFKTTVAATFGSGDTNLSLTSVAGLPSLTGSEFILLTLYRLSGVEESGHEVVKVTSITGSIATVIRSFEGAAASQFLAGDKVGVRVTASTLQTPASHVTNLNNPHGTTASQIGLGNVDNTSDVNKPVSTLQAAADTTTLNTAKAYADGLVVGLWDDRGNFNASVNNFPSNGGSGTAGAILKGDVWTISVGGTLGSVSVVPLQTVRALIDTPGQTPANWGISAGNASTAATTMFTPFNGITENTVQEAMQGLETRKQGLLSSGTNIKTVGGTSLLGSGDIPLTLQGTTTASVNSNAVNKGSVGTGTVTFTQSVANYQTLTVTGALTVATNGWPTAGPLAYLILKIINGGSATITLPTVNWLLPNGTTTTSFSTYMTALSRTSLKTSGADFITLLSDDAGTTLYGKVA